MKNGGFVIRKCNWQHGRKRMSRRQPYKGSAFLTKWDLEEKNSEKEGNLK